MSNDGKVALLVCGGIGRIVSTVVRQAAYMAAAERPDNIILVSSGSLTGDVPQALQTARTHPLVAVDACVEKCASALVSGKQLQAKEIIFLPDVAAKYKVSIADEDRKGLSDRGMRLARKLADEIIEYVDALSLSHGRNDNAS